MIQHQDLLVLVITAMTVLIVRTASSTALVPIHAMPASSAKMWDQVKLVVDVQIPAELDPTVTRLSNHVPATTLVKTEDNVMTQHQDLPVIVITAMMVITVRTASSTVLVLTNVILTNSAQMLDLHKLVVDAQIPVELAQHVQTL